MLTHQQSETLHGHDGGQTVSLPKIGESEISSASLKLLEFDGLIMQRILKIYKMKCRYFIDNKSWKCYYLVSNLVGIVIAMFHMIY